MLEEEIKQQRTAIDTIYQKLISSGADGAAMRGAEYHVTLEEFQWAMDTVISRTFGAQVCSNTKSPNRQPRRVCM